MQDVEKFHKEREQETATDLLKLAAVQAIKHKKVSGKLVTWCIDERVDWWIDEWVDW